MNPVREAIRRARTTIDVARSRRQHADLAVFHEFMPAPYGGAHQFLRALCGEFERRGVTVSRAC